MDSTQITEFISRPDLRTTKRLSLNKVPRSHVQQLNRVFKRRRAIEFDLGEDEYTINFIPFTQYQIKQEKICVRINNRFLFHLNLEVEFFRNVLNDYPKVGNLSQMPAVLRKIALEVAAERLFDRFDHHFNCKSSIIPLSDIRWSDYLKYDLFFEIIKKTDRTRFCGSIKTNRSGIDWIVEQLDRLPEITLKNSNQIPLEIFFEIGRTILSIKDLDDIEPGDIIILDSDSFLDKHQMVIRMGPLALFSGSIDPAGKIKIEEKLLENMEEKMEETPSIDGTISKDERDKQIDDIPVKLVFQLGETRMKFGELIRLQPGYIFAVETDINKPVTIKVNGRPVGKGELVEIGDSVGVRVLQLEDY
jgi:flagellar motor switch protein FliN